MKRKKIKQRKKPKRRKKRKRLTSSVDSLLLVTLLALILFGLLMIYSAIFYVPNGTTFWHKQLLWAGLGVLVMALMAYMPYTIWQQLATPAMLVSLVLLVLVLIFGKIQLGAQRSFLIFGISVQPGVLARLTAVLYIAAWLASKGEHLSQVHYGLVPFAVITGVVTSLIALQPDLSIALLLATTALLMFFYAGGDPVQIFLFLVIAGISFMALAWQLPHARDRLVTYTTSLRDMAEMSYHGYRSVMAIAQGGVFGLGVGNGRLKAGYLPFPHTDSIFAVIGEELGLLGTLTVLGLFGLFAYRGYRIALGTPDPFGSLLAFGVTTMIIIEAMLNVLVMIGLVPFTGTALPFFSYGGSQMLVTLTGAGVLLSVSRGRPKGDWDAILDRRWRDWWARLSGTRRRAGTASH
jgi:cell division protein FtsW